MLATRKGGPPISGGESKVETICEVKTIGVNPHFTYGCRSRRKQGFGTQYVTAKMYHHLTIQVGSDKNIRVDDFRNPSKYQAHCSHSKMLLQPTVVVFGFDQEHVFLVLDVDQIDPATRLLFWTPWRAKSKASGGESGG